MGLFKPGSPQTWNCWELGRVAPTLPGPAGLDRQENGESCVCSMGYPPAARKDETRPCAATRMDPGLPPHETRPGAAVSPHTCPPPTKEQESALRPGSCVCDLIWVTFPQRTGPSGHCVVPCSHASAGAVTVRDFSRTRLGQRGARSTLYWREWGPRSRATPALLVGHRHEPPVTLHSSLSPIPRISCLRETVWRRPQQQGGDTRHAASADFLSTPR